jgi:hypothetical protein
VKPRSASRPRRFGPVDVGQVDSSVMARTRRLVRPGVTRIVVVDVRTVLITNVSAFERNPS